MGRKAIKTKRITVKKTFVDKVNPNLPDRLEGESEDAWKAFLTYLDRGAPCHLDLIEVNYGPLVKRWARDYNWSIRAFHYKQNDQEKRDQIRFQELKEQEYQLLESRNLAVSTVLNEQRSMRSFVAKYEDEIEDGVAFTEKEIRSANREIINSIVELTKLIKLDLNQVTERIGVQENEMNFDNLSVEELMNFRNTLEKINAPKNQIGEKEE